jgi:hypothetical protein
VLCCAVLCCDVMCCVPLLWSGCTAARYLKEGGIQCRGPSWAVEAGQGKQASLALCCAEPSGAWGGKFPTASRGWLPQLRHHIGRRACLARGL